MEFTNFLGGLWIPRKFGGVVPGNGLLQADDIVYLPYGGVRGRSGRVLYGGVPNTVVGLWRHYPRSGTPAFIEAEDTGSQVAFKHDTVGAGTFSAITGGTGFATGARPYFTNWPSKNKTFFANGFGVSAYNGVIASVVMSGTQITGPYLTVHQSRLVGSVLSEINYSIYFTAVDDETTVTAGNQFNMSDPQGGSITGLVSLAGSTNVLVVLKSTNLWTITGDLQFNPLKDRYSEVGCVAPASVAVVNDEKGMGVGFFFVGRAGVYYADGQAPPINVSGPIEPLFIAADGTTFNTHTTAVGAYVPQLDAYLVKLAPADTFCYMLQRLRPVGGKVAWCWAKRTSLNLTAAASWDSESDNGSTYFGGADGNVWRINYGSLDGSTPYIPTIQLPFIPLHQRHHVGRIQYGYADYFGSNQIAMGLRYDNAASADVSLTLGAVQTAALQRTRERVVDESKSGQFVSATVALPQDGPGTELYRIALDARLRSSRVWR